jgi:hypothetical protein
MCMALDDLPLQPDPEDEEPDQDAEPPGDGMPERVHTEDPAEGPDQDRKSG